LIEDVEEMRQAFIKRLEGDAKKNTLLDTGSVFRAYATLISILRATIDIPLRERRDFIAKGIDDRMVRDIQAKMGTFTPVVDAEPILPRSHPQYKAPGAATHYDPESALGDGNIGNHLPIPKFYPRAGDTLNLTNTSVTNALLEIKHMVTNVVDANANTAFDNLRHIFGNPIPGVDVVYTVQLIDWGGRPPEEQIWDTRSSISERPTLLRMVQRRTTLGIRLNVNITHLNWPAPAGVQFEMDLVPYKKTPGTDYVDFSDYSSVFFRKEAYERGGGFIYPNPAITSQAWSSIDDNEMSVYLDETVKGYLAGITGLDMNFTRP